MSIDGTFLPPTGDDFRAGTGVFLACWEDKEELWFILLLAVEAEVVLGLPVFLDIEEVVGEPTMTGGDGDWVELAGCTCAVDDLGFVAKDIWV